MKVRKAYKFRIFPNKPVLKKLDETLGLCRELYNAALDERRNAYRLWKSTNTGTAYTHFEDGSMVAFEYVTGPDAPKPPVVNYENQANQLVEIKEARPEFNLLHSQVLQNVLKRLDLAFSAFFRRVQAGETPGYPRFKSKNRYDSFTFPQGGWSIKNNRLTLSKIGTLKVKLHRCVIGKVKTCTIKRECRDKWFVIFSVESELELELELPLTHKGPVVGIDCGLEHFANLSNGEQVENPRFFRKAQKRLAKAQRKWDKVKHLKKGDVARQKPGKVVSRMHRKVKNCRSDFQHKLSRKLVNTYSLIAVENLNIKGLAGGRLAKSVNDAAWGQFLQMLKNKAEEAGSLVVEVDPRFTSQTCPNCGSIAKKELAVRWHSCPCGCEMHRDISAAQVILSRGLSAVRNHSVAVEATPL